MPADLSSFFFGKGPPLKDAHAAHVPAGIGTKKDLLAVLRRELALPEYFGGDWDSLEECLKDLSWLPEKRVVIVHEDVPALSAKDAWTYLSILSDAARDWKDGEEHVLEVVFPKSTERILREKAARVVRPGRKT